MDHPCTFSKSWVPNALQSANHRVHPCTLKKLGTKSKLLVNNRDHPCNLLLDIHTLKTGGSMSSILIHALF
ncbi:hypothetical protein Hanom_Chr15g01345081 [Helianthus anomalus]